MTLDHFLRIEKTLGRGAAVEMAKQVVADNRALVAEYRKPMQSRRRRQILLEAIGCFLLGFLGSMFLFGWWF